MHTIRFPECRRRWLRRAPWPQPQGQVASRLRRQPHVAWRGAERVHRGCRRGQTRPREDSHLASIPPIKSLDEFAFSRPSVWPRVHPLFPYASNYCAGGFLTLCSRELTLPSRLRNASTQQPISTGQGETRPDREQISAGTFFWLNENADFAFALEGWLL